MKPDSDLIIFTTLLYINTNQLLMNKKVYVFRINHNKKYKFFDIIHLIHNLRVYYVNKLKIQYIDSYNFLLFYFCL